jgi:DNA primase catalytic core
MATITNLNQTSPDQLKRIIEDNGITIKKRDSTRYQIICPECNKPEAYIYFNEGSRVIQCNRQKNCNFSQSLWEYIANKKGRSSKEMTKYINELLGYEFKDFVSEQAGSLTNANNIHKEQKVPEILEKVTTDKPIRTQEEIAEEQQFFKACHQIFKECLEEQDNEQVSFSLRYLKEGRGYDDKQITSFELGFFPDEDKFILLLVNAGYSKDRGEELIKQYFLGILNINKYQKGYEETKNRITFTWFDTRENIVGFSTRKPSDDQNIDPKYLNNKGLGKADHLFNLTKEAEGKNIVIVEGQLDALAGTYFALPQEEMRNYHFVAISGNNISERQVACLKALNCGRVILLLDNDEAGRKGAIQTAEKLIAAGISPDIATMPKDCECKDIDELIRKYKDDIDGEYPDLKEILDYAPKYEIAVDADKPVEKQEMSDKNTKEKLHPKILELLEEIKKSQEINREDKEILDIHKFRIKCYEIEKLILEDNINEDRTSKESNLKALSNILNNINKYNDLLTTDYDNDQPFTWGKYVQTIKNNPVGLKTGFSSLDKYVTIQSSSLAFIAGRPSHGKTTMMLNILRNMVIANPDKVFLFYSYEEEEKTILSKIILIHTEFNEGTKQEVEKKYPNKSYLEIVELEIGKYDGTDRMVEAIYRSKKEVEEWIYEKRLQILDRKPSVESLTSAIIERCMACSNSLKADSYEQKPQAEIKKEVAAVFIDYVQKLTTEEERVNRQQEIQRICNILLSTTQDKRVKAAFILGTQANREAKSSDTFNLHNMKDAGDIEQDANLVLGVWNPLAAQMQMLQSAIDQAEMTVQILNTFCKEGEIDLGILVPSSKNPNNTPDKNTLIKAIKFAKNKLRNLANAEDQTLTIKILKNRNGKKDLDISLNTRLSQFLVYEGKEK